MEASMLKKKRVWRIIFGIVLGLFFCCLIPYQGIWIGCMWWNCAPERGISVWSLELPPEFFPEGADVGQLIFTPDGYIFPDIFSDEYSQWISWGSGRVSYDVWEFVSANRASQGYKRFKEINYFFSPLESLEWQNALISYKSEFADESFVTCGIGVWDNECIFRGRFEEYYIDFTSTIDEKMPPADYVNILRYIEQKIMELLDS
jgi:hypothetical protein